MKVNVNVNVTVNVKENIKDIIRKQSIKLEKKQDDVETPTESRND